MNKQIEIGRSKQDRPINAFHMRKGKGQRKKVLLISCLHGDEQDTVTTNVKILHTIGIYKLLNFWEVMSIPIANPDGRELKTRYNSEGIDLNRDFIEKKAQETRTIINSYEKFQPEIVIDYHSNLHNEKSLIILPSKNMELSLINKIIQEYDLIREQLNLGQSKHLNSKKERIASLLAKGIYKLNEDNGAFIDYAAKKSKIAIAIEDYGRDLSLDFSLELLKACTK